MTDLAVIPKPQQDVISNVCPFLVPSRAHRPYQRKHDNPMSLKDPSKGGEEKEENVVEEKKVYVSPRCTIADDQIFPGDHSLYRPDVRWQQIQEQAGLHRLDGSVLTIGRNHTPQSLKFGMTAQVASRVRRLNLWLDHNEDILPKWLDVVASLFVKLETLNLLQDCFPGEEEIEVSSRMRRLYVLYRLPDLKSIDDVFVSRKERKLARPNDPISGSFADLDEILSEDSLLDGDGDETEVELEIEEVEVDADGDVSVVEVHVDMDGEEAEAESRMPNYDDDNVEDVDIHHETPRTPVSESIGNCTANEFSIEVNERVGHVTEDPEVLDESVAAADPSEERVLAAEGEVEPVEERVLQSRMSSSTLGEQREDQSSDICSSCNRDGTSESLQISQDDAIEVELSERVEDVKLKDPKQPEDQSASNRESINIESKVLMKSGLSKPCEMVSVAREVSSRWKALSMEKRKHYKDSIVVSPTHEWTAACGVLSFRSDRACAPRLRLGFCGRSSKKVVDDENQYMRNMAKETLRRSRIKSVAPCLGTKWQSTMAKAKCETRYKSQETNIRDNDRSVILCPSARRLSILDSPVKANGEMQKALRETLQFDFGKSVLPCPSVQRKSGIDAQREIFHDNVNCDRYTRAKFFSDEKSEPQIKTQSANKKLPPSQSLSSPFPMQFRERSAQLQIFTSEMNIVPYEQPAPSSPRACGSFPMDTITKPITLTCMAPTPRNTRSSKTFVKGDLPPPCPGGNQRKKIPVSMADSLRERKEKKMMRRKKALQESGSVLDHLDEEDSESEDESENEEAIQESDQNLFSVELSTESFEC